MRKFMAALLTIWVGLSGAVFLTINSPWLLRWTLTPHVLHTAGLSAAQVMDNYYQLLAYLELPWVNRLSLPNFPFSRGGLIHMATVKNLFLANSVTLILALGGLLLIWRHISREKQEWRMLRFFQTSIVLTPLVIFFLGVDFDRYFIIFHQIIFSDNYWIFDPKTDPIINVLTDRFFTLSFMVVGILFELYMIIFYRVIKKQVLTQTSV
ncbi:TIGR01906 family membrane protein [Pediococcus acidilactici]|nr:TIGR01906 family membrane protein [Pediococcus acidilactici]